jgi:hypothetical protein
MPRRSPTSLSSEPLPEDLAEGGFKIVRSALLLTSGRALPELKEILASHALIHAADGELFRESLGAACGVCDVPVEGIREKELFAAASSKALGVQPAALNRRITALGKALGPPWSQDEKFAVLAAWLTLARQAVLRVRSFSTAPGRFRNTRRTCRFLQLRACSSDRPDASCICSWDRS